MLAAGPAVARRAQEKIEAERNTDSRLLSLANGNPSAITAEMVARAWREGDAASKATLEETADLLAIWLGNMIDILEPDVIVIGGGMSELVASWFDRIRTQIPQWSVNSLCDEIRFVRAQYGEDSGIAGAAALCVSVGAP